MSSYHLDYFPEQFLGHPSGFEADRNRQFEKFDRLIQLTGFDEMLATPESRTDYIDSLRPDEFEDLLIQMNGFLINVPRSYRGYVADTQIIKGHLRNVPQDIMPAPEDKRALMGDVLRTAQQAETLDDKAFILSIGINLVHPFAEGNGRLARSVYYLLTEGYKPGDPKLRQLIGSEGESLLTPDPNVMKPVIMGDLQMALNTHVYDPATYSARPRMILAAEDPNFNPVAVHGPGGGEPTDRSKEMAAILANKDMSEMLPALLWASRTSAAAKQALVVLHGQAYFALDKFWAKATAVDMEKLYKLYAEIKFLYVQRALEEMLAGPDSTHLLYHTEYGQVASMPMGVAMKKVMLGEIEPKDGTVFKFKQPVNQN